DYQAEAVGHLLAALERAKKLYSDVQNPQETSVALTAPTGAGKTVIAAAVIEALFFGSDRFDFAADSGAVVIWFSDDPNLNDQSRFRLMQASEKLTWERLVHVRPPFAMRRLEPGRVYFLNTQRLSKSSLLTRGYVESDTDVELEGFKAAAPPDELAWNIWQTIDNTILHDDLTVYFVLDEAHRGFDTRVSADRETIVGRLVAGDSGRLAMPIVLGISATIGRFKKAMDAADASGGRLSLPDVVVEPSRVQASGLVKDTVVLDIPGEVGDFGATLAAEAAKRLKGSALRWKRYALKEGSAETVVPLLVFQIPNTPDSDRVGEALDAIHAVMPDLTGNSVRHVLGSNTTETFGRWEVDWIEPQRVQETTDVRVLVAKEAISTGWDCPRAEVLVSLRPAKDQTHIAQLLGRMVRSPLARRVPGDDRLNAVDCILPYFDRTTAGNVVKYMTGQIEGLPPIGGGRVLIDGRELQANPQIGDDVWAVFDALPTQAVPQRGSKPVKRLVALAQALSADGLRPGALAEATRHLHNWLDGYATVHAEEVAEAVKEVRAVHIETLTGKTGHTGVTYATRTVAADDRAIRSALDEAKRVFGADVAQSYVGHLADSSEDDEDLRHAYVRASALATVKPLREKIDSDADHLALTWFAEHRVAIKGLTDERQQEYEDIRSLATEPQRGELRRPRNRLEDFAVVLDNDQVQVSPLVASHLMSDDSDGGEFPIGSLNSWEQEIVTRELARPDSVAWYRNPSHNGVDSLTVAYRDTIGDWRSMHPDFVFFNLVGGLVRPSIVDPHGQHLEDSLVKLQGLANFAERYGDAFHRIETLVKDSARWKVLDLKRATVRSAISSHAGSVLDLYLLPIATDYA
ncbi:MAG: DEAD/DEAH box helicase family protein, partial [Planctomycetes bacterium]|nr:DEAD/DEAH box helicase family protein [Planctomycetota bacterium]